VSSQPKASRYTCKDVARQATAFLENQLPAAQNILIWRHLEGCADCRTYIEQMAVVRDSLRKLPEPQMPDERRKKLLARLRKVTRDSGDAT
jgi:predicted anti-sigma-YlaC factor YlaD